MDIARHRRTDPSALVKQLRGDLDWITMKALDKDRTRRYATASELGEDIQRHLAGNPVVAAPPSAVYRLRKLIKRRRGMFATVSVLTLAITGGLVVSTVFYIRADRERQTAEAVAGFFGEMLASVNPQIGSKDVDVREVLDRSAARIDDQFPERPLVRAFLQDIISRSYGGLGLPQVALQHAQSAVAIRERELGESHPDTLHSMDNLGYLYNGTGDLERSEEICAKPLAVRQDRLGDDHPDTLLSHYHHGLNLFAHHQYREAARVQRMVWEGQRRALGGEHPNT